MLGIFRLNEFIKAPGTKRMQDKKKDPTLVYVYMYDRQICPSSHCLASLGRASRCQAVAIGTALSILSNIS